MLKSRSFDIYINTVVLIIVILDCSEVGMEILNTSIKTTESNNYREVSENNKNTNSMLATI